MFKKYKSILSLALLWGISSVAIATPVVGIWSITNETAGDILELNFDLVGMDFVFDVVTYNNGQENNTAFNTVGSGQGRPFLQDPTDSAGAGTASYSNQISAPDLFQTFTILWNALDPFAAGQTLEFLIDTDRIAGLVLNGNVIPSVGAFDIVLTGADFAGMNVSAKDNNGQTVVNTQWIALPDGLAGGFNPGVGLSGSQTGSSLGSNGAVPEPGVLLLIMAGVLGMSARKRGMKGIEK